MDPDNFCLGGNLEGLRYVLEGFGRKQHKKIENLLGKKVTVEIGGIDLEGLDLC